MEIDKVQEKISDLLVDIHNNMFNECKERMSNRTTSATTLEEFASNMDNNQGFIKTMWCGDEACEDKIKEISGAKSRCMPFEQESISDTCVCCGKKADKMVIWGRQY
ncbi:Proline--tRNA ligase [compost metagenome]